MHNSTYQSRDGRFIVKNAKCFLYEQKLVVFKDLVESHEKSIARYIIELLLLYQSVTAAINKFFVLLGDLDRSLR